MVDISPELALQLIAMRDSLLKISLTLHELRCAMDFEARKSAMESTNEILKRHGCRRLPNGFGDCS